MYFFGRAEASFQGEKEGGRGQTSLKIMSLPSQAPPAWLAEEEDEKETSPKTPLSPRIPQSSTGGVGQVERGQNRHLSEEEEAKARMLYFGMKGVTLMLCVLMFSTACISLEGVSGVSGSGQIFVATYMIFFSILLSAFEITQMQQIIWLDHMLRRNFGFLFSAMGKAFFIIFVAFLCLGLDGELPLATGIAVAVFGGGQVAMYLKHPEFFEYIPPGYGPLLEQPSSQPAASANQL